MKVCLYVCYNIKESHVIQSTDYWAWFFDNMLRWENPEAGLAFAQHYVHELLRYGENVKAVKVMLRCRLINPAFRPLAEDIELAIHAAEHCQNDELASSLR